MRSAMLTILIGCLLVLAGCIDYQETITLNDDGSGTISIRYAISKAYLAQAEQFSTESYDEMDEPSEDEIREQLETTETSVKLISFEESEDDEWRVWAMEFSFDEISDFNHIGRTLGDEEYDSSDEPKRSFSKQPDGTRLFTHSMGGPGGREEFDFDEEYDQEDMPSDSEYAEAMSQMQGDDSAMAELAEGMEMMFLSAAEAKMKVTVNFPGAIVETNATIVEGNTAVWESTMLSMPPSMTAKIKD